MTKPINILVTGSSGQLGFEIDAHCQSAGRTFFFTDVESLDITDQRAVNSYFKEKSIHLCINAAGYTSVDKAESEPGKTYQVNETGARYLAEAARHFNAGLIHISTDFVFAGTHCRPYKEEDVPRPLNVYGKSKLAGERAVRLAHPGTIILRTSWLYSTHGANFVKTMLRIGGEGKPLRVIDDQIGTPTYAADLAEAIGLFIGKVEQEDTENLAGLYHFSNEGAASWYDFAKAVFDLARQDVQVSPVHTEEYPTPAVRPHYSVLDKKKIKATLGLEINHWRDSLAKCIHLMTKS